MIRGVTILGQAIGVFLERPRHHHRGRAVAGHDMIDELTVTGFAGGHRIARRDRQIGACRFAIVDLTQKHVAA